MPQAKRKQSAKPTTASKVSSRKPPQKWQLQTAKAKFSELFRLAMTEGPQHVTRQGKEEVVIISKDEFDTLNKGSSKAGSAWEFFRSSPLVGLELDLEREQDLGRDIEL